MQTIQQVIVLTKKLAPPQITTLAALHDQSPYSQFLEIIIRTRDLTSVQEFEEV